MTAQKLAGYVLTLLVALMYVTLVFAFSGCIPKRAILPSTLGALEQCRASLTFADKADERIQSLCADEACRIPWRLERNTFLDETDKRCADVNKTEVIYGKNR